MDIQFQFYINLLMVSLLYTPLCFPVSVNAGKPSIISPLIGENSCSSYLIISNVSGGKEEYIKIDAKVNIISITDF